ECIGKRIYGADSFGRHELAPAVDAQCDGGLRTVDAFCIQLTSNAEALERKELGLMALNLVEEELERSLGTLELIAQVLQLLDALHGARRLVSLTQFETQLGGLVFDVAAPGQVGNQDAPLIPDRLGFEMLVGARVLHHGRYVHPTLVSKG